MRMRQDVLASGSYISSNDRRLHFGLGMQPTLGRRDSLAFRRQGDGEAARGGPNLYHHRGAGNYGRALRRRALQNWIPAGAAPKAEPPTTRSHKNRMRSPGWIGKSTWWCCPKKLRPCKPQPDGAFPLLRRTRPARRRQRNDRTVGMGQHLVHHAVAGDGGERRCACAPSTIRSASWLWPDKGVPRSDRRVLRSSAPQSASQLGRNEREQTGLNLIDGTAGEDLCTLLWLDDMLQNQARVVLRASSAAKRATYSWPLGGLPHTDVSGGKFAVGAIDHIGPTMQQELWRYAARPPPPNPPTACRWGRESECHDDAVDLPLVQEGENLVGGQSGLTITSHRRPASRTRCARGSSFVISVRAAAA